MPGPSTSAAARMPQPSAEPSMPSLETRSSRSSKIPRMQCVPRAWVRHSSMVLFVPMSPPPRMRSDGLMMFTALANASPASFPAERRSSVQKPSPMLEAMATSCAVTLSALPRVSPFSSSERPSWIPAAASRAMARPDATASRQPRLPQLHNGPPGATMVWPISPDLFPAPRRRRPFTTIAIPMP